MKVIVNNDLIKAVRKLAKMKSISGTTSSLVKESRIFEKGTTIRRKAKLAKKAKIKAFKSQAKQS